MTTITQYPDIEQTDTNAERLRLVLRMNAAFSTLTGTLALLAPAWVADTIGVDHPGWIRAIGLGLLGFALIVLLDSGASDEGLGSRALLVSIADLGWVVGTIPLLASDVLDGAGPLVAGIVGVVVLDLALAQLWFRSRIAE